MAIALSGRQPGPSLSGRVRAWQALGDAATLPVELGNDHLTLRFVEDATYGVALATITHHGSAASFAWTNNAGPLFRVVTQGGDETTDECSDECGAGFSTVLPTATVAVGETEDPQGRPAFSFRWEALALLNGGTIDVTVFVALGESDRAARWTVHVVRDGEELDGIEWVACPVLSIEGPVAARAATTHEASQVRARHLLPAHEMPALGSVNVPLSLWSGEQLVTHHPTGNTDTTVQPMQFEALYAGDPQDTASMGRVLFLGSADLRGAHKQFRRAGVLSGEDLSLEWEHRYYPAWATHPIDSIDDTSRLGNVFHADYPALTGCLEAPTAAWWHTAAAFYRDQVAERMAPPAKRVDTLRSALAKGEPFIVAREQSPNMSGLQLGGVLNQWTSEALEITDRASAAAQWGNVKPTLDPPVPAAPLAGTRGCNYLPMAATSHSLHLAWTTMVGQPYADHSGGFFHEPHLIQELDALQAVGFNALRVWGSFMGWVINPTHYVANLKTMCARMTERGLRMNYVLFNQVPAGIAALGLGASDLIAGSSYNPSTLLSNLWAVADSWNTRTSQFFPEGVEAGDTDLTHYPEPATGAAWDVLGTFGEWSDTTLQALVVRYVREMATFFGHDADGRACHHSIDIYNEVDLVHGISDRVRDLLTDFLGKCAAAIRSIFPDAIITVGWAGGSSARQLEVVRDGARIDYQSLHTYNFETDPAESEAAFQNIATIMGETKANADAIEVPWLLTECFVVPENEGEMDRYLTPLSANGGGGFTWCYLQNNAYRGAIVFGECNHECSDECDTGEGARPFDGIARCTTPATLVTRDQTLTHEIVYPVDDATVRAWVTT